MKKYYLFISLVVIAGLNFGVSAQQLKSISQTKPVVDTTKIVNTTEDVKMQNAGVGSWTIKEKYINFTIKEGDNSVYDASYTGIEYAVELIGGRRPSDANYCNSFILWAPADSGVPWNYKNSKVKLDIKILDSENYAYNNNGPERDLALYVWVAVKHDWDSEPQPKYVRLFLDSPLGPLQPGTAGGGNTAWSNQFTSGVGMGLNDHSWHSIEVDLIKVIEAKKQACIDGGIVDPSLGNTGTEGVKWNWYGVLGLEIFTLDALIGDVTVVGQAGSGTAVNDLSFENSISVYPNPTSGNVKIGLGNINNAVSVDVYSLTGQLLKTVNNVSSNSSIELGDLGQGYYILKVSDGQKSATKRVVVL